MSAADSLAALAETTLSVQRQNERLSEALAAIVRSYDYNPGCSDLDNEQTIYVRATLGDYRKWCQILARQRA